MPRKSYRKHKRGGSDPNLPYAASVKFGGRRHRKHMRGGTPYTSATTYGSYVNGSENAQYDRVFSQAGPYASIPGNESIGAQGQNSFFQGTPTAAELSLIQKAGSKRRRGSRRSHTKRRRGGFIGPIINQAIVPFGILGLQQSYKRNKHRSVTRKSRRRRY